MKSSSRRKCEKTTSLQMFVLDALIHVFVLLMILSVFFYTVIRGTIKKNLENQGKNVQFVNLSESLQKDIELLSLEGFFN